ncbi:MAG: leucyl/phenylalanyl-tRNA--protein transferase [Rhodobacteraceae bacterium]|nr:leucyl/phenylalanyl-tRNA--protein transferase [Paracoccaceae bacterium]
MSDQTITHELLLRGYATGIFPMAESRDDPKIHWIDPHYRGILPLDGFHISRSLRRTILTCGWTVKIDTAFSETVEGCADRPETWINPTIFTLYTFLFTKGFAHSFEVWDGPDLIGGVYGITLGAAFFGESMFSRQKNASKLALAYAVHRLRTGGFNLFDTQFLTPHLASLGGIEIPRSEYHRRLAAALSQNAQFNPEGYCPSPSDIAPSSTGIDSSAITQRST